MTREAVTLPSGGACLDVPTALYIDSQILSPMGGSETWALRSFSAILSESLRSVEVSCVRELSLSRIQQQGRLSIQRTKITLPANESSHALLAAIYIDSIKMSPIGCNAAIIPYYLSCGMRADPRPSA